MLTQIDLHRPLISMCCSRKEQLIILDMGMVQGIVIALILFWRQQILCLSDCKLCVQAHQMLHAWSTGDMTQISSSHTIEMTKMYCVCLINTKIFELSDGKIVSGFVKIVRQQ